MRPQGGYGVEVIATGDEILLGRITDTNSSWLARRFAELGGRLSRVTCVGDSLEEIGRALLEALGRGNDLIVLTGGLGPSEDDLTIEAIGQALGRRVELNPQAVEMIRGKCEELGVELTPRRQRMARLLEGSSPAPNQVGMAPGMVLEEGKTTIVALPGIPDEMKAIFDGSIAPLVERKATSRLVARTVTVRIVWRAFFPLFEQLMRDFPRDYLKHAATPPIRAEERERVWDIKVDVVVEADSAEAGEREMDRLIRELRARIEAKGGELIT